MSDLLPVTFIMIRCIHIYHRHIFFFVWTKFPNNYYSNKIKKNSFSVEDIINQVAYENYKKDYSLNKIKSVKKHKISIIKNCLSGMTYKNKILYALDRLGYEQDQAAEKFYEMFEENGTDKQFNDWNYMLIKIIYYFYGIIYIRTR